MYVHYSTVYNSKDLEPTQVPTDDRLDKENVAHIHHGILCSNLKWWVRVVCRDMDGAESHYPQQTKHCIFSLIGGWWKMRTHGHRKGSTKHWGLLGVKGEGQWEGQVGRDSLGRNAKCRWRGESKQNTLPCVYLCNCIACSAHVPQNLKCNKKIRKKKTEIRNCESSNFVYYYFFKDYFS